MKAEARGEACGGTGGECVECPLQKLVQEGRRERGNQRKEGTGSIFLRTGEGSASLLAERRNEG